jgi:hypothetical protein
MIEMMPDLSTRNIIISIATAIADGRHKSSLRRKSAEHCQGVY